MPDFILDKIAFRLYSVAALAAELETTLSTIVKKITPAVVEILNSGDGGKIELHFAPGRFRQARKEVAL